MTQKDVEAQSGVDALDVQQAKRAAYVDQAAPLRALRDTFDADRKRRRSEVAALILAKEESMSEAKLERLSSGDERYGAYLDECKLKFAQLAILEDKIRQVDETIRRGDALIRFATYEPK
jgi:hypothetical protein